MRKSTSVRFLALLLIGLLQMMYSVGEVKAPGIIYIRPDGSIDPQTAPIQRSGDIYNFTDNIFDSITVQRNNILIDGSGYAVQGVGDGNGIELSGRQNVTIKGMNITEWGYGVYIHDLSSENTIKDSTITKNALRAIFLSNSTGNTVHNNSIIDNVGDGVFLWRTNTTTITCNNVSDNGESGITIGYSSFYNVIANNTVANNSWAGISQGFQVNYPTVNVITGNNITGNVWAGIYLDHVFGSTFYHNNLLYNTNQVVTVGATNAWDSDYPSGGNYWSDYAGLDSDGDGIGDTAHTLDENNRDNYPFTNPWAPHAHDTAIVEIVSSKNIVGQGFDLNISVIVANQGSYSQTFNVTVYVNTTAIKTETVALANGDSETITFTWNTSSFAKGNWTLSAYVDPVPGEIDTADNTRTDGTVRVMTPGDVNADGIVDILDAASVSAHWYPGPPIGPLGFDSDSDINNDEAVDILDAAIISAYWTGPPKGPLAP